MSWAEAAERVDDYANGLLALGVRKGDAFAILAPDDARVDALRPRARADRRRRRRDLREQLAARRRVHPRALGVRRRPLRGRRAARQGAGAPRRAAAPRARADVLPTSPGSRPAGVPTRHAIPTRSTRPREAVDEDDLFTFIYTSGTTGPPKGCMISHRNEYAMVSVVDELERFTVQGDVMLLYLPLAHNFGRLMSLSGPYCGYTIAFLPDPLQAADALTAGAADRLPERAARVREGPHRRAREVRRGDRASSAGSSTGRSRVGPRGERASPGRQAGARRARVQAPRRRPARLLEDQVAPRRSPAHGDLRRRAARARDREFFHAIDILILEGYGLTECDDRHLDQPATTATASARSARRCRASR